MYISKLSNIILLFKKWYTTQFFWFGRHTPRREVRAPLCLVTNPTIAMHIPSLFKEEEVEMKRLEMLLYGVLLSGSRKSWKTFKFELKCRDGGYINYSQTGSARRRKGKSKKPNASLPDLTPAGTAGTAGTGVTEPPPLTLPTSGDPPQPPPNFPPTHRAPHRAYISIRDPYPVHWGPNL